MKARKACILLSWELIFCLNLEVLLPETEKKMEAYATSLFFFIFQVKKKAFWEFCTLTASFLCEFFPPSVDWNTRFSGCWDTVPRERRQKGQWPQSETSHHGARMAEGCTLVHLMARLKICAMILLTSPSFQGQDNIFWQGCPFNTSFSLTSRLPVNMFLWTGFYP